MYLMRNWRVPLAVLFVAMIILAAGGLATASNMGFKMNRALVKAGTGQIGNNWISIPYNNPYGTIGGFCQQTGLPAAAGTDTVVERLNGATGVFTTTSCLAAGAGGFALVPGEFVRVRPPNAVATPASIIIVGSHNPTLSIVVPPTGAGQKGNFWFSVPYHTTAVTLKDLCDQIGMVGGVGETLNASTGTFTTKVCTSADAGTVNLVLGEGVRLRQPTGGITFIPSHF